MQKLDLRNYQLDDVKLMHLYDGDFLIPLKKGDYIVYYPSKKDDEVPIGAVSELTIGMIFYHFGDIDLSDYIENDRRVPAFMSRGAIRKRLEM